MSSLKPSKIKSITKGKTVVVKEIKDLVQWFETNHESEDRLEALIYKKHTGHPVPSHNEQIRAAICYGWIDTTVRKVDDDRYSRIFYKRKDSAKWSPNTLKYAEELTRQGKMKPLGTKHYLKALEKEKLKDEATTCTGESSTKQKGAKVKKTSINKIKKP